MVYSQSPFDIRFEWGIKGVETLSPISDAIIIVDVMSFSTAVTVAVAKGAIVFPYRWKDDNRIEFAKSRNAILACPRGKGEYSLSPLSLNSLKENDRIVLPSPNGATLSLSTGGTPTYVGCLRNASYVAKVAQLNGDRIAVIACGERWVGDDTLRPSFEDLLGAGAVISYLNGRLSPEAISARSVFENNKDNLNKLLENCSSGRELIGRKYKSDIKYISELNVDETAPKLNIDAFMNE
ncbi:MAG: 2-phosphosulfolactate phosphatase [Candidatus Heimdallarchaeota archaeon LC_2]|nr:MAG: 2-phosphosulfolactate phosphatase [Candidatus Heimdallarchaeota archaeon LC_2]